MAIKKLVTTASIRDLNNDFERLSIYEVFRRHMLTYGRSRPLRCKLSLFKIQSKKGVYYQWYFNEKNNFVKIPHLHSVSSKRAIEKARSNWSGEWRLHIKSIVAHPNTFNKE